MSQCGGPGQSRCEERAHNGEDMCEYNDVACEGGLLVGLDPSKYPCLAKQWVPPRADAKAAPIRPDGDALIPSDAL